MWCFLVYKRTEHVSSIEVLPIRAIFKLYKITLFYGGTSFCKTPFVKFLQFISIDFFNSLTKDKKDLLNFLKLIFNIWKTIILSVAIHLYIYINVHLVTCKRQFFKITLFALCHLEETFRTSKIYMKQYKYFELLWLRKDIQYLTDNSILIDINTI